MLDIDQRRLSHLYDIYHGGISTLYSNSVNLEQAVLEADIVIGAVLVAGARAPVLVGRELVAQMKRGSVIVDVAVDQGGCVETIRPTSHSKPIYVPEGVIHYGVPNMPGAVPRTSTLALNNATFPYLLELCRRGVDGALAALPALGARRELLPRSGDAERCRRRARRALRRPALAQRPAEPRARMSDPNRVGGVTYRAADARLLREARPAPLRRRLVAVGARRRRRHLRPVLGLEHRARAGGCGGLLARPRSSRRCTSASTYRIAEMSPALPHTGGAYSFARTAMGPWGGFVTGLAENVEYILTPAVIVVLHRHVPVGDLRHRARASSRSGGSPATRSSSG